MVPTPMHNAYINVSSAAVDVEVDLAMFLVLEGCR